MNNNNNNKTIAVSKYLRLSPQKVNRVLRQIKGKNYQEAILILQFMPYKACLEIIKVLKSAGANAEHNQGKNKQSLKIQEVFVNKGPTIKRFQPRAQGRAFQIHKPTCHISLSLTDT